MLALLVPALAALLVWSAVEPRWETNDDPAMMMVAHGFGLGVSPSPNLIYSNVIWGHLVRAIPWFGSVPGYSIASMAALLLATATAVYALLRLGVALPTCTLAIALCLLRALVYWQFTVIAGLLAVAGVLLMLAASRAPPYRWSMLMAVGLLLLSTLIRAGEMMLVLAVALPLLMRREVLARRDFQISAASLIMILAVAFAVDRAAYMGEEWRYFRQFEQVRVSITDFQAGDRLLALPDVMQRHGLHGDEVQLLQTWGFWSPELTNPDRLVGALAEIGHFEHRSGTLAGATSAILALGQGGLPWLSLAAIGLLALRPNTRLVLCWIIMLLLMGTLGAIGRPGVERVYLPLLILLILAPLASMAADTTFRWMTWRGALATAIPGLALIGYAPPLLSDASRHTELFRQYRSAVDSLGGEDLIGWGWRIPYEYMYAPLGPIPSIEARHLSLGAFTYVPSTCISVEEETGRGALARLRSPKGILVAAGEAEYRLLRQYLKRRFGEDLSSESVLSIPRMQVSRWRVSSSEPTEQP